MGLPLSRRAIALLFSTCMPSRVVDAADTYPPVHITFFRRDGWEYACNLMTRPCHHAAPGRTAPCNT